MIVENTKYLQKNDVKKLYNNFISFGIYKTSKDTYILITDDHIDATKRQIFRTTLSYPDYSRILWKLVEGKKVSCGMCKLKISSYNTTFHDLPDYIWNNGNQILSYKRLD